VHQGMTWKLLVSCYSKVLGTKQIPWPEFDGTLKILREKHWEGLRFHFYNLSTWGGGGEEHSQFSSPLFSMQDIKYYL